jgi:hypothetical protein
MRLSLCRPTVSRALFVAALCVALSAALAADATAARRSHGQLVQIVKPRLRANAAQSGNWFGYNQGTLEQGTKQFHSVAADWTVPTATQHTAGRAENSSTWIGIGGGCIDANCNATDSTLIQTGTEQDVDKTGKASYSAWWELVPAPSLTISNMTVAPGDHMHADISETVAGSELWKITIQDTTRNETFTTTVPYTSTHATAEWIEETPVVIGTDGTGFAALPNLTSSPFDNAATNGAPAGLKASEQMQLVDSGGSVIGAPSAPDSDTDGFGLCAWSTSCSAPGS